MKTIVFLKKHTHFSILDDFPQEDKSKRSDKEAISARPKSDTHRLYIVKHNTGEAIDHHMRSDREAIRAEPMFSHPGHP